MADPAMDYQTVMGNVTAALRVAPATPPETGYTTKQYADTFSTLQDRYDEDVLLEAKVAFWVTSFDLRCPSVPHASDIPAGEDGFYAALRHIDDTDWFEKQIDDTLPELIAYDTADAEQWYTTTVTELERRGYENGTAEAVLMELNRLGNEIQKPSY